MEHTFELQVPIAQPVALHPVDGAVEPSLHAPSEQVILAEGHAPVVQLQPAFAPV